MSKLVFLARPSYGPREPEADVAARHCVRSDSHLVVHEASFGLSMTSANMNDHLCECVNSPNLYQYFALQHADMAPADGWVDTLVNELEEREYDVIHAPAAYKNESGKTSTGIICNNDGHRLIRKLMVRELAKLPQTFDIDDLRQIIDPTAEMMLFNTGCMVARLGPWINEFPGFHMIDRIDKVAGKWFRYCMSEDYTFAKWCGENGVRAGATRVATTHYGRKGWSTTDVWGAPTDEEYLRDAAALREAVA